jgi:hypothetical protein
MQSSPARERMKVRVLIQRAIPRAIQDSAFFRNCCAEVTQSSPLGETREREQALKITFSTAC